jgi:hypothetical protein
MNALSLLSPNRWYDVARDHWLQSTLPILPVSGLSWSLNQNALREIQIIWPSRYSQPLADKWLGQLKEGFAGLVQVEESAYLPLPRKQSLIYAVLRHARREHLIAVDFSDYPQVYAPAVDDSDCYFKMQYHLAGYGLNKIVPGGFVPNHQSIYKYASRLRLERKSPAIDLYGRFSSRFGSTIRTQAFSILENQRSFSFVGELNKIRYSRFLEEAALARLCLDLPGNGGFCFRLIDYLALGQAIIAPRHENKLHVPLENGKHVLYCKPDLSDLVETCESALSNPKLLLELRKNAAEYFDNYLHQRQLAAYYLHTCIEHLL